MTIARHRGGPQPRRRGAASGLDHARADRRGHHPGAAARRASPRSPGSRRRSSAPGNCAAQAASPDGCARSRAAAERARPEGDAWLSEAGVEEPAPSAGVPVPEGRRARSAEECVRAAKGIEWPLALKLSGPRDPAQIGHRGDRARHRDRDRARARSGGSSRCRRHRRRAPRRGDGPAGRQSSSSSPPAPTPSCRSSSIGLGGIWTEALDDVADRPPPRLPGPRGGRLRALRGAAAPARRPRHRGVDLAALASPLRASAS